MTVNHIQKTRSLLLAALLGIATGDVAFAQQARTRTLTLDPATGEWMEAPPPPVGTAEGDLHAISVQISAGQHRSALKSIKKSIRRYGETDSVYPALLIAQAEALVGRCDYVKAHKVLREFLTSFQGVELTSEAIRLEFVIAEAFLAGAKRKFLGMRVLSGADFALQILDTITADYPETGWAEYAMKTKADHLFYRSNEHLLAEMEYARLLQDFPRSRYHQPALLRSADAVLAGFRGIEYDEAALVEAEERYHEYRGRYAASADREGIGRILQGIAQQRAEKEFSIASYYERTAHAGSAIYYYRSVVENWPRTLAAVKARERLDLLGAEESAASAGG